MPAPTRPRLTPGRVYRTKEFARWTANPSRLAGRLVGEGELRKLGNGLYYKPRQSRFGEVPPSDEALMRGFLKDSPFVFTGPEYWNALGLGSTALSPETLVYNKKRTGSFDFGTRRFRLRRMPFPRPATPEWYAVDLMENGDYMDLDAEGLSTRLGDLVREGRLSRSRLEDVAKRFGTRKTQEFVGDAMARLAA